MRRTVLAAASAATLACLGACGAPDNSKHPAAQAVEQPTASAESAPLDPFAWTDVPYKEYLDAAQQIGLRPDVLQPAAGFSAGLNTLCHTSDQDLATMRKTQMSNTRGTDTYTSAKYLGDEVGLRIGMACPQRMSDWAGTADDPPDNGTSSDGDVSAVTDADLARAAAEEASASSKPDHGDNSSSSGSHSSADPNDSGSSGSSGSSGGGASTTNTGGTTAGNGALGR